MVASKVVCPIDGSQLILVSNTNLVGDAIHRWECPVDDWAGPWYSKNQPMPELLRNVKFVGNPIPVNISGNAFTAHWIDNYNSLEGIHQVITGGVDTTISFSQLVRGVRISNWNPFRILIKDGPIESNTDTSAARVGKAAANDLPGTMWFPFATDTVHLRSRVDAEITIEGYFGRI